MAKRLFSCLIAACFAVSLTQMACAAPAAPATDTAKSELSTTTPALVPSQPAAATSDNSALPDLDIEAPIDRTKPPLVGPAWVKPVQPYRGDSFSSGAALDPGRQDRHLPLPGIAVKVPLY